MKTNTFSIYLEKVFDMGVRVLLIFLPFSSFISVFLTYKVGIHGASFLKEIILVILGVSLFGLYLKSFYTDKKYVLHITLIDILIIGYILLFSAITIGTTGISGLIFGGRYDFVFLGVFLIFYHGFPFLSRPLSYYLRLFLLSAGCMLFASALLKWPFTEDILLFFGYSGNPSAWDFGGAPPIFHGIDGANVRRFQGLLDGPNTMGAFLILFSTFFAYFLRNKKEWYFVICIVLIGLLGMIFYTYSRSALIGVLLGYTFICIMSLGALWKLYKMQLISAGIILSFFIGGIGIIYADRAMAIVGRAGSTQGHAERMQIGLNRIYEHPLGQGLGSAGPGYRYVMNLSGEERKQVEDLDKYYIPESWYIQQGIEGGFLGGVLFLFLMGLFFIRLFSVHIFLAAGFFAILVMNLFLHTFESSVVSWLLFALIGITLADNYKKKYAK